MRAIPDSLDPAVVAEIDARLAGIELDHGVRIPWAIESGSRAWGFPSPDSDYDCRFIYVRPHTEYLTLWPARDVIETPVDRVFDVNGWDLAKAVRLVVKGNAAAIEWLRSPIVYSGDEGFRDRLLGFADEVVERVLIARHYLHVARQQQTGTQSLKRFFYVLRPAAALRWLADNPEAALPPMDLPTLLRETDVPSNVRDAASELIATKAVTRELGSAAPHDALVRFVAEELDRAEAFEVASTTRDATEVREQADAFFQAEIAVRAYSGPAALQLDQVAR
jgi:predicted nucleotidyltransferase